MRLSSLLIVLLVACSTGRNVGVNTVSFSTDNEKNNIKYSLLFNEKIKIKDKYEIYDNRKKELNIILEDSIIVFLSLDKNGYTYVNSDNLKNLSMENYTSYFIDGNSELGGTQPDGKIWRQILFRDIVIGYLNVPETRKQEFDSIIENVKTDK